MVKPSHIRVHLATFKEVIGIFKASFGFRVFEP